MGMVPQQTPQQNGGGGGGQANRGQHFYSPDKLSPLGNKYCFGYASNRGCTDAICRYDHVTPQGQVVHVGTGAAAGMAAGNRALGG